jgi:uncharacterized protein YkwD
MRRNALSIYKPYLLEIKRGCDATGTWDWNGDGEKTSCEFLSNSSNILAAANEIKADNLGFLEWTPGLFLAAKDGSNYMKTSNILTTNGDGHTHKMRVERYGTTGASNIEFLYSGNDTPKNVVAKMLIDDLDSLKTGRNALLAPSAT